MSDDLVLASTTDTEEQITAALGRGIDTSADEPILGEVDATTGEPIDEPAAAEAAKPAVTPPKETAKPAEQAEQQPEKAAKLTEKTEKQPRADKRISQLTAEKYTQMRRAEQLEAQVAELQSRLQAIAAGQAPLPVAEPAQEPEPQTATEQEPQPKDFQTYEEYIKAVSAFAARQQVAEQIQLAQEQAQHTQQEKQAEQTRQTFEQRREEAASRYPDFEETMVSDVAKSLPMSDAMQYVIMTNPIGHDMAYYLVKHPEVCDEISKLQGPDQILRMGELAGEIKGTVKAASVVEPAEPEKTPKKPVSQAPTPIEPVGARATTAAIPDDQLDWRAWADKRNASEQQRRLARRGVK